MFLKDMHALNKSVFAIEESKTVFAIKRHLKKCAFHYIRIKTLILKYQHLQYAMIY